MKLLSRSLDGRLSSCCHRLKLKLYSLHGRLHGDCARRCINCHFNAGKAEFEAGIVGREGMTGFLLAGGIRRANDRPVVQVQGTAFRMRGERFERAMASLPVLQKRVLAHSCSQAMQFAQNVACNRIHSVTQRLAKWLMMVDDRTNSDIPYRR